MPTFHLLLFLAAVDFELGPRSLNQRQGYLGRLPLGQLHDLEVEDHVPEDEFVLLQELLLKDNLLTLLLHDVDVLFVEGDG